MHRVCLSLFVLVFCFRLTALPAVAEPLITEFMAANDSVLYDEDGASSDWIEIHNPDDQSADLAGYYLTDDPGNLTKWQFPEISLPPGGYVIVFASNKDRSVGELHTNFRLPKNTGGFLALIDPDGQTPVSTFTDYPQQFEGFSYGLAQTGGNTTDVLIREGDACRLLVPTSNIGTGWREVTFDDNNWSEATTGVGYERSSGYDNLIGPGGDVEDETYDTQATVYIRIPFTLSTKESLSRLLFRMKYDDGFVAYLNGTEIASGNSPANPTWDSDASADHPDGQATTFEDTNLTERAESLLRVGNNVLAIHAMNNNTTSSDLLALPRLEAEFASAPGDLGGPGHFQTASPGTANGTDQGLPAGPVTASPPGRGFTGTVSVSLSTASATAQIRYTTNGDVPTATSALYTGGSINISTSRLLRARAFETGLTPGPIAEEGYIRLASNAVSFSSDIPVVVMEEFSNGGPTASNGKNFTFFAFFEPDPETGRTTLNRAYNLGTRGGWKVRGSSSSGFPKKAYSIEAWNKDNRNKNIAPLGMPEESDWILNARSVFDRSLMRNAFIYELSNQIGRYATRTRFVELFKDDNGGNLSFSSDYDGVYTFMEKISRDKNRVDVERLPQSIADEPGIGGGYMLKVDRLDPGDSGLNAAGRNLGWVYPKEDDVTTAQANWMRNYLNEMSDSLSTADYADYIDVDSWVDHHLLNVLTLNADALRLSTYFYKTRHGKIEFGPIWDFDRSMESTDGRDDNPSTWSGGTDYFNYPWWGSLFDDENFWQRYIDRYFELRENQFSTSNVHAIIDGMAAELDEAQERNFDRWSDQPRFGSYRGEVNHLKDWLATRLDWMDGRFAPRVTANRTSGVYPAGTTVTLSAPPGGNRKIYYTLDGTDPRPPAERATASGTALFDATQTVRAFVPTSNIGNAWRNELDFNDVNWRSGSNGVGYERGSGYDPYINIDVDSQMANRTSCYIRMKFDVDGAALATWNFMTLQMRYDDGFVAYLNGSRIAADRAPSSLSWNSSATQTHDDGAATVFQTFEVNEFLSRLTPGENLLAIHALNESTTSSDFLNQSRLVAGFDEHAGNAGGANGIEYTGPITLTATSRLIARVFDSDGGHSPSSGQTPVGTGWGAPLSLEYLVDETPASPGTLAITEIMYDAYDLGPGAFEWIELQNVSNGTISLTDVMFQEGINFIFPGRSLAPGERVLVVDDSAAFAQIYGASRLSMVAGNYGGGLADGGERLTLTSAAGSVIQSIEYAGNSANRGYSLVADGQTWRPSRSVLGSPGKVEPTILEVPGVVINEVLTNSVPPEVDSVELYNTNDSTIDISGWFLTDDLSEPGKFQIPNGSEIAASGYLVFDENDFGGTFALSSFGEEIFILAATPDGERLDYVDGFDFGDASAGVPFGREVTSAGEIHYVPMSPPTFGGPNSAPVVGPLVITELMYHPPAGAGVEFIELQNIGGSVLNLTGVELSGAGFAFDADAPRLAPGEVVLLVAGDPAEFRASFSVPLEVPILGPLSASLDNGGETLRVRRPESSGLQGEPDLLVSIDIANYDDSPPWPTAADGGGDSLHRILPPSYAGDPKSWEATAPTPGTVGHAPEPIPVTITSQPRSWTVDSGAPISFSVTATGTAPIHFQWRRNGEDIAGANSSTYTIPSASDSDGGIYDVVVRNVVGEIVSNAGTLTVNSTGFDVFGDWLAANGYDPNTEPFADANLDGFANVFHYLMNVPLESFIANDPRGLSPQVNPSLLPDRAAYVFKIPSALPSGLTIVVEASEDGFEWSSIAQRAQSGWNFEFPDQAHVRPSIDGLEMLTIGTDEPYHRSPIGLFRLKVLLAPQ